MGIAFNSDARESSGRCRGFQSTGGESSGQSFESSSHLFPGLHSLSHRRLDVSAYSVQVPHLLEQRGLARDPLWNLTCSISSDFERFPGPPLVQRQIEGVNRRYPPPVLCLQ